MKMTGIVLDALETITKGLVKEVGNTTSLLKTA